MAKSIFESRQQVVSFLEKSFEDVSYKAIIDKKIGILHEYYSNDKKIAYTEYQFNPKDEEKINFKHKLVLVDNI